MGLLIKNGTLVTAERQFSADICIENGKIVATGSLAKTIQHGDKVVDAHGKYVIPGGIDPHVHMHLPTAAGYSSDDFLTGSQAALFGGTTSLIDFVTPRKGQSLKEAFDARKKEAAQCLTDYSFHVSPVEWRKSMDQEISGIKNSGITSFKVYMAYKESIGLDDEDIEKVMRAVADVGGIVTMHCELGDEIDKLRQELISAGNTGPAFHPLSRPAKLEAEAVKKAVTMAAKTRCPLYIVHVSAAESLKHIRKAQQKGQMVFAETCPHYLLLNDDRYLGSFEHAAPFVLSPPLRKKEDSEALWKALADESIQSTGTDHCPFTMEQKRMGTHDFTKIANGAGGVEHRLKLLYTYGVLENRISLERFVALTSTLPAKIFGLYPAKGSLEPGADADLVIWNPDKEETITAKTHHMHCDTDIFEGFTTKGVPEMVIKGGIIAVQNNRLNDQLPAGRFLYRK